MASGIYFSLTNITIQKYFLEVRIWVCKNLRIYRILWNFPRYKKFISWKRKKWV